MGRTRRKNLHLPPRMHMKRGRFYHVTFVGGKRIWTPIGATYAEAVTAWAQREAAEAKKGETFEDLAREFALVELPQFKPKTQKEWSRLIGSLARTFAKAPLEEITPPHINGHITKRRLEGAPVSGNREAALLQRMLSAAVAWGWITTSPYHDIRKNKELPRDRYLSNAEFNKIRAAAGPMVRAVMDIGYLTGLRVGDLLQLKTSDIEDGWLLVRQQKNEVRGRYLVNAPLTAAIDRAKALRRPTPKARDLGPVYLFAKRDGKPYSYYGFRSIFDRACKRAGVEDVHFHDIRAKAITDAKGAGRDPQAFSLHRSREQAEEYVRNHEIPTVVPVDGDWIVEFSPNCRTGKSRDRG